jgi:hypothetical protein
MKKRNVKAKLKYMLFILFVFCMGQVFPAECGDVDSNGAIDIIDALLIAQAYVGLDPAGYDSSVADVNGDSSIDIVDALLVAQYYVGLISSFSGCGGETPAPTPPPQGNDCSYVPEWSATEIYDTEGTQVQYNGDLYENNWYTQNDNPEENSGVNQVWTLIGPCDPNSSPVPGTPTPSPTPGDTGIPTDPPDPNRTQAPYPDVDASECGNWVLIDNVCSARYCSDNLLSEDCSGCGGNTGALCQVVSSKAGVSGAWPEVHSVSDNEPWHYSRSTHYGIGKGGACAFGVYGICSDAMKPGDAFYNPECEAFCNAYPDLCADPPGTTFRANWVAPQGNYYTQFWPTLPGDWDNYLSCGECFELARTKPDGTDYQPGESGYTDPVIVTVADSCPCSANSKWCCGAGRNHCYEVEDFEYGCPLPGGDLPPDRDPSPEESIHIDLCSIAMARLQSGSANGGIVDGVIPTKYRRVPCPVVGNIHVWLLTGASNYYFALTVVNVKGLGSVTNVEAQMGSGEWAELKRDPNYTSARPQERFGTWVTPPGSGPFDLPISLRFTNGSGTTLQADGAIQAWTSTDSSLTDIYFIDTGVQF